MLLYCHIQRSSFDVLGGLQLNKLVLPYVLISTSMRIFKNLLK